MNQLLNGYIQLVLIFIVNRIMVMHLISHVCKVVNQKMIIRMHFILHVGIMMNHLLNGYIQLVLIFIIKIIMVGMHFY